MWRKTVTAVCLLALLQCASPQEEKIEEDYLDEIMESLLKELNDEVIEIDDAEREGMAPPIFSDGRWLCGNCTHVDESEIIYTETDTFSFYDDTVPAEFQIALSVAGMRCVVLENTNENEINFTVEIGFGSCDEDSVMLVVKPQTIDEGRVKVVAYGHYKDPRIPYEK